MTRLLGLCALIAASGCALDDRGTRPSGCDGAAACGRDRDRDGVLACDIGSSIGCDCDDSDRDINPGVEELCGDQIDQDCDGADACCDDDGDGYAQCRDPTTLERTGDCIDSVADCREEEPPCDVRTVEPSAVNPGAVEVCFDGIDNDCNGRQDELASCVGADLDGDGVDGCEAGATIGCEDPRYDCDSGIGPQARERCRPLGIDEDLDGRVDEDCPSDDVDGDGQSPPMDCHDADPLTYVHAAGDPVIERCGDGYAQSCGVGATPSCDDDTDGDRYVEPPPCEGDPSVSPDVAEVCNGRDDDCDGIVDETRDPSAATGCAGGVPIVFTSDVDHCGACRRACGLVADACEAGVCDCGGEPGLSACAAGETCCTTGCADLANDPTSCGGCGIACGSGEACVDGRCGCGAVIAEAVGAEACPEATDVCCAGGCLDVTSDAANCGACGAACGPNATCAAGGCACDPPSLRDCNGDLGAGGDGCETDVRTALFHCGGCGRVCELPNATETCVAGTCALLTCEPAFADCDGNPTSGCETSLRSLTNCGACGTACALPGANSTCATGACLVASCQSGRGDCTSAPGCETMILASTTHCGLCGNACRMGETCSAGNCRCGGAAACTGTNVCCPGAGCQAPPCA